MKYKIKHRYTDSVLFEADIPDDTPSGLAVRAALEQATKARANLDSAYLAGANLGGAYLVGAKIRDDITITRAPLQLYGLAYPVMIFDSHIKIGCELHSIKEWTAFDDIRIAQMDGATARRFWSKHKDTILALSASDKRGETM